MMKKVVFCTNNKPAEEKIGSLRVSPVEVGEYLDLIEFRDGEYSRNDGRYSRKFLITRDLKSEHGEEYTGKISVNDVEFDVDYETGNLTYYYCLDNKNKEALVLENRLNNSDAKNIIESGHDVRSILSALGVPPKRETKDIWGNFEKSFMNWDGYEMQSVIGLPKEIFETLKISKKAGLTAYQMYAEIEKLKNELEESKSNTR